MQPGSEGLGLDQALSVLRRRLPLIALCVAVVAGAALGISARQTKKYTATASLIFSSSPLNQQIAGLPAANNGNLLAEQASNVELVKLGDMSARTARLIGHGLTQEAVARNVSVSGQGESSVVGVSATEPSPWLAAQVANTYVRQFVAEQQSSNKQYFKSALALVHKQLAALPPQQRYGTDGLALQNRAQTLGFLSELGYGNVQVAQLASPPAVPSSPKTSRNTIIGGILGLLIGLGLAFLLERLDRRVADAEDLASIYGVALLGSVPKSTALSRSARRTAALPHTEAEAFELIYAHLRFSNADRDLRTLLIASAEQDDGKTTIARRLAEAAVRMGTRTLLIEADLRRPQLARQLGVGAGPGLVDVLTGSASMRDTTQRIETAVSPTMASGATAFDLVAAGALGAPTPGQLINSPAMDALMTQARSVYDLVLIDAPPLTTVWDAFPLLGKVDGVVVVGRVRHSRQEQAERLREALAGSRARVLGVIANGTRRSAKRGARPYVSGLGTRPAAPAASSSNGASPAEELLRTGSND